MEPREPGTAAGRCGSRERLALLLEAEIGHREERRTRMAAGIAKFPFARAPGGFDLAAQPSLDPGQIRDLAACRWGANGDALLVLGPPGVGKTPLAVGLGREAIRLGHSVLFVQATALITALARAHAEGRLGNRLAFHAKPRLLIIDELAYIDELGHPPFEPSAAPPFFQLVSRRHERGSLLVTSNRSTGRVGRGLRRPGGGHRHPRPAAPPLPRRHHPRRQRPAAREAPLRPASQKAGAAPAPGRNGGTHEGPGLGGAKGPVPQGA